MFRASQNTLQNVPATEDTITATAGGTKAAARPITADASRISVCATAADSVLLPPALKGSVVFLANDGVASCQVFGQGTDTIDGVATGTGKALAAAKRGIYVCITTGAWLLHLTA
jgi:uncharacterized protein (DUF2252 family)